jgi:TonB family protein
MRKTAASTSLILHLAAMALLFLFGYSLPQTPLARKQPARIVVPLTAPLVTEKPGGGGGDSLLPAPRGRAPEPVIHRIFIPPAKPLIENPKLPLQMAMIEEPEFNIAAISVGNPLSPFMNGDRGRGAGFLNLGDGDGRGIGDDDGPGLGGRRPAVQVKPRITRGPEVVYSPEPEYSEEARKVRFQGTVVLSVEIGADGRTSNIRVMRAVGLGLDEKAVEAVSRWRFRPAIAGDRPVAVTALVEVSFHLL